MGVVKDIEELNCPFILEKRRWLRQLADATMMEGGCSFRCSSVPEDGYSTLSLMFINIVLWVRNLPQIVSFVLKKTVLER